MARHFTRTTLRCAAVAAAMTLPVVIGAGPAGASTSNWGWGGAGQPMAPGVHHLGTGFSCRSGAPCGYNPGMTVMVTGYNGTTLSAPSDLVEDTGGTTVGSCQLEDSTHIVCTFATSGSSEHAKGVTFSYTMTVPGTGVVGSTVATQTWADDPQTGNLPGDDTYTFTLSASQTKAATSLAADPALLRLLPPRVTLGTVSARLTTATGPVAGASVAFTSGSTTVCTGVTGTDGTASCSFGLAKSLVLISNGGFTATYAGGAGYLPSSGDGALIG